MGNSAVAARLGRRGGEVGEGSEVFVELLFSILLDSWVAGKKIPIRIDDREQAPEVEGGDCDVYAGCGGC